MLALSYGVGPPADIIISENAKKKKAVGKMAKRRSSKKTVGAGSIMWGTPHNLSWRGIGSAFAGLDG